MSKKPLSTQLDSLMKLKIKKIMKEATKDSNIKELAELTSDLVYKRTKLGYGVNSRGSSKEKLKPLSPKYKKHRKKAKLHPTTSPSKSNLTYKGEMLDSLTGTSKHGKIEVECQGSFNKKKAKWNSEKGRTFLELSNLEIKEIGKRFKTIIQNIIRFKISK